MSQETMQRLPLSVIDVEAQIRENANDASVPGLAESMAEVDQLQPIRVRRRGDRFVVVDGERRLLATKMLGRSDIAAIIEERELCPAEVKQRQLIANVQRKGLVPLEAARAIDEIMQLTGWNQGEVAGKLGLKAPTVSQLLALLSLPEPIQEQVESGAIPRSTGYEISKVSDPVKQAELATKAANGEFSRDETAAQVRQWATVQTAAPGKPGPTKVKAALADGHSITISGSNLTLKWIVSCLKNLLAKACRAERQGLELSQFLKQLKEQT